jgi:ribosomal protein L37AE/L43A
VTRPLSVNVVGVGVGVGVGAVGLESLPPQPTIVKHNSNTAIPGRLMRKRSSKMGYVETNYHQCVICGKPARLALQIAGHWYCAACSRVMDVPITNNENRATIEQIREQIRKDAAKALVEYLVPEGEPAPLFDDDD